MVTVTFNLSFVRSLVPVPGDFLFHRLDHLDPAVAVATDGNLLKKTTMAIICGFFVFTWNLMVMFAKTETRSAAGLDLLLLLLDKDWLLLGRL